MTLTIQQRQVLHKLNSKNFKLIYETIRERIEFYIKQSKDPFRPLGFSGYTDLDILTSSNEELLKIMLTEEFWGVLICDGCNKIKAGFIPPQKGIHVGYKCKDYDSHVGEYNLVWYNMNFFEMRKKMLDLKEQNKLIDEKDIFGLEIMKKEGDENSSDKHSKTILNFYYQLYKLYDLFSNRLRFMEEMIE